MADARTSQAKNDWNGVRVLSAIRDRPIAKYPRRLGDLSLPICARRICTGDDGYCGCQQRKPNSGTTPYAWSSISDCRVSYSSQFVSFT